MKEFGERLKKLRQNKKMSQEELGLIFNPPLAQSTIGTYERGVSEPTYSNLVIIAKHFNTTTDYLLGLTNQAELDTQKEDPKELKEFLLQNNILFNGNELSDEDRKRMIDILTGLFWNNFTQNKK